MHVPTGSDTTAQESTARTPMEIAMRDLDKQIVNCQDQLYALRDRLAPILVPIGLTSGVDEAVAPTPVQAPIVATLEAFTSRLEMIQHTLASLRERLAV